MKKSSAMEIVKPILALGLVCLIVTGCLAVTNYFTAPVIEAQGSEQANAVRREVLPEADAFSKVEVSKDITESTGVYECYQADNGAGYVLTQNAKGYAGPDTLNIMYAYSADGTLTAIKVVAHEETPGLGSRATEDAFLKAFIGKSADTVFTLVKGTASADGEVAAIAGATISSRSVTEAVSQANQAFSSLKEAGFVG